MDASFLHLNKARQTLYKNSNKRVSFQKQPKTYSEQVSILKSRGLLVDDEKDAECFLSYCNYYRFNGYVVPFEECRDRFLPGIRFQQIRELYEFDRKLRQLVMEGVSTIEVFARTKIAYFIATKYGAFGHYNVENFIDKERSESYNSSQTLKWSKWNSLLQNETERSREDFLNAYRKKYRDYPKTPIWITSELCSFGSLSVLFSLMSDQAQTAISADIGISGAVFQSWLHSLHVMRNCCAHFSRLWNRRFDVTPKMIPEKYTRKNGEQWQSCSEWSYFGKNQRTKRTFCFLTIINALLKKIKESQNVDIHWKERVLEFLKEYPNVPNFEREFGIPNEIDDWRKMKLWK